RPFLRLLSTPVERPARLAPWLLRFVSGWSFQPDPPRALWPASASSTGLQVWQFGWSRSPSRRTGFLLGIAEVPAQGLRWRIRSAPPAVRHSRGGLRAGVDYRGARWTAALAYREIQRPRA